MIFRAFLRKGDFKINYDKVLYFTEVISHYNQTYYLK